MEKGLKGTVVNRACSFMETLNEYFLALKPIISENGQFIPYKTDHFRKWAVSAGLVETAHFPT